MTFETVNELALKIHMQAGETVFTKAGAFISGESVGEKNYKFEKVLLGPQGNAVQAALGQLGRRLTGENLPLMKVTSRGENITYYANEAQHVTVVPIAQGMRLSVESENILAFNGDCGYSIRFLAQGVLSQKGLATSTLTGKGPNALAAVLTDGNPLLMTNMQNGAVIEVDPDAVVAWVGADPSLKTDLSWKNLIGQASGESYMFEWKQGAQVIIQPNERKSGLDVSMDGRRTGQRAQRQDNPHIRDTMESLGGDISRAGSTLSGGQSGGGLGSIVNSLFRDGGL